MIRFAEVFADEAIVSTLWRQLSWSHFKEIIYQKDALQRDFYAEMCRVERWSVRTLRQKIDSMLYERTAISNKPEELIRHEIDALRRHDQLTPDLIFKDPYLLDFLGLRDHYLEKDMEDAILRELEQFLLVLCAGKKRETVELLELEASGIRVAEYMTELPSRKVLEQKLHAAIVQAKKTFENRLELTAGKEDNEQTR